MLRRAVLPYRVRRDGMLFLHVEWDRVGRCVPGLRRGRGGSAGGLCGQGGADGDVYAGRGVADVFDTGSGQLFRQALLARQQRARNRWASRGWAGGRRGEQ
ncbi:LOW QUALITY PROTEIN: hypothetical protein AYX15_04555 [Cryptococcus neoformans]|nr:LOW QUALITY PROTEIN: hypothetical protein AYX15_04555 [Cryptococcus neoformans var. grubii]